MRRERWTEFLIEIHSAMQTCPHEILSELLAHLTSQQQPLLLQAVNFADLEAKWEELIQMGRNLRNSAEWNAALDELMPKALFDRIRMPFVLCKTLEPRSLLWFPTDHQQIHQPIYQGRVFYTIRPFLAEMLKMDVSLYDAWCISNATQFTLSILTNLLELLRQRVQLQITTDELLIAYNRSAFKMISQNFRGRLIRMFFENVPSTIR